MKRILPALLMFSVVLTACGGTETTPLLSADGLRAHQAELDSAAATDMTATSDRDAALLRSLYDDGIVIEDGEDQSVGIDELVSTAEFIWAQFPDSGARHTATYVGTEDGVVVIEQWGFAGYAAADPFIEFRVLEIDNRLITSWTATYDMGTRPFFGRGGLDEEAAALLNRYIAAWNSRDPSEIGAIYDPAGIREDVVFGGRATGREAIEAVTDDIFSQRPDLRWQLLRTIGIRSHTQLFVGGVFMLSDSSDKSCEVEAVVLLEGSGDLIERERIYYDTESLVECGWAY